MIKNFAIAAVTTLSMCAPAYANEDILKGIFATIIIHEVLNKQQVKPAPAPTMPAQRAAPGYYDSNISCRVDVHRGTYYTTRTVYNCQGAILEHQSWQSN